MDRHRGAQNDEKKPASSILACVFCFPFGYPLYVYSGFRASQLRECGRSCVAPLKRSCDP